MRTPDPEVRSPGERTGDMGSLEMKTLWAAHGSEHVYISCAVKLNCATGPPSAVSGPPDATFDFCISLASLCVFLHLPPTPLGFSGIAELDSAVHLTNIY